MSLSVSLQLYTLKNVEARQSSAKMLQLLLSFVLYSSSLLSSPLDIVALKLSIVLESPDGLVNTNVWAPSPESDSYKSGVRLENLYF